MDFIHAETYFGTVVGTTGSLPQGFTRAFIFNDGTADVTLTGKTGTFILSPDEKIHFEPVGKPYNSVAIDASSGSVKYGYIQA